MVTEARSPSWSAGLSALCVVSVSAFLIASSSARANDRDHPAWPVLLDEAAVQGGGEHDAALVVGVEHYYNLPEIPGAIDNARAWQQWLLRSRRVPASRVVMLGDREATRGKIEKNLKLLANDVGAQGTLWFVFIGHGAPAPGGDDGLLLGVDTDVDADSVEERGVPQQSALSLIAAGRQAHGVVVFDACFSGRTGDGRHTLVPGLQATVPTRRAAPSSTTTVLAASDSFAGPLPGGDRPAFSYLLLGAVRGWADEDGDHDVDVGEAYAFARGTLQALMKGSDRLPRLTGPSTVLATNAREEPPDIAALAVGHCPSDTRWDGRRCKALPAVTCPAGTTWSGGACVGGCPAASTWDGTSCVADHVLCASGTTWDGRGCSTAAAAVAKSAAAGPQPLASTLDPSVAPSAMRAEPTNTPSAAASDGDTAPTEPNSATTTDKPAREPPSEGKLAELRMQRVQREIAGYDAMATQRSEQGWQWLAITSAVVVVPVGGLLALGIANSVAAGTSFDPAAIAADTVRLIAGPSGWITGAAVLVIASALGWQSWSAFDDAAAAERAAAALRRRRDRRSAEVDIVPSSRLADASVQLGR